jgi:hypothetical protein
MSDHDELTEPPPFHPGPESPISLEDAPSRPQDTWVEKMITKPIDSFAYGIVAIFFGIIAFVAKLTWRYSGLLFGAYLLWFYIFVAIPHTYPTDHTNFWYGLIHGIYMPIGLVISVFNHDVAIYQSPNDGFWYGLGFYLGASQGFLGIRSFWNWLDRKLKMLQDPTY